MQLKQWAFFILSIVVAIFFLAKLIKSRSNKYPELTERNGKGKIYRKCNLEYDLHKNFVFKENFDEDVVRRHPNLPSFLVHNKTLPSVIPNITSIRWNGIIYQESWAGNPKFLLYSASFETRSKSRPTVRFITLYDGEFEPEFPYHFYCQFWYQGFSTAVTSTVYRVDMLQFTPFSKDYLNAYEISCQVPTSERYFDVPVAVSIVKHQCETPTNILKIAGSPMKKKKSVTGREMKLGVCVKNLLHYNEDFSPRLIEWIEMMKILGASKIFFYQTEYHENIQKVLDFYEKEGTVKLISFYYPPPYVQEPTFLRALTKSKQGGHESTQRMYLDDCLLRNKDYFQFLVFQESDEVPILREHKNLTQFLRYLQRISNKAKTGSLLLRRKFYYEDLEPGPSVEDIPENFYILRHNRRTKLDDREAPFFYRNGKNFYDNNYVLWVNCQEVQNFVHKSSNYQKVERKVAYMAYFGDQNCSPENYCKEESTEEDNSLLLYKDQVIDRTMNVIRQLDL